MRSPALCILALGLVAVAPLPPASAIGCDNALPWQPIHCHGEVDGTLTLSVHYHPNDGDRFNDYAEVCFVEGDPTGGWIGDCRGVLIPTLP